MKQRMRVLRLAWLPLVAALALPAAASAAGGLPAALAWLRSAQLPDGGFSSGLSQGSDLGATADAVIAIASAGQSPGAWRAGDASPLDLLRARAGEASGPGLAAKVALASIAAGQDPADFGGLNLTAVIEAGFNSATGFYGAGPYDSALSLLALAQAHRPIPPEAVAGLVRARQQDGSYAFDGTMTPGSGDSNTTALAVQALLAAGAGQEAIPSFDYFRRTQNPDGGWTYQKPSAYGESTDANSTALVLQALLAGGQDLEQWGRPQESLLALQQPSGALAFNAQTPGDNALATIQAIPALAGVDLTDLGSLQSHRGSGSLNVSTFFVALFLLAAVLMLSAIVERTRQT
ncbi:MAG TPA: hypothetical protein VK449_03945, partial [Anaerolineales bacterium]|nr:hypothetical protein [Anaerolineales bacterium]